MSYNWISTFQGLSHLDRMQCLTLYNNIISKFEVGPDVGLKTMSRLKKVSLARNMINSSEYLNSKKIEYRNIKGKIDSNYFINFSLSRLYELDMRENQIRYQNRYFELHFSLEYLDFYNISNYVSNKWIENIIYSKISCRWTHVLDLIIIKCRETRNFLQFFNLKITTIILGYD